MGTDAGQGRFAGAVVLITGASGGLGRRMAQDFAAEAARLVLGDRDAEALATLAAELPAEVATVAGDIRAEETAQALVAAALESFGALDVAVNNAGIATPLQRLPDTPTGLAEEVLAVNVMGPFLAMKHQLPAMAQAFADSGRRGAIVNMASVAGLSGASHLAVYAASKHAVVGLTRSAALEYARRGVRVNAVCPSFTRTPMLGAIAGSPDEDALTRGIPMRRLATPEEVSAAVLFAADPANGFMTGQALGVDGGLGAL